MDKWQFDKTRKLLKAVLLISAVTGEESEQVLDRVLNEPPRKGPTPAVPQRRVLFMRASA
jgi:hypothetical protein